MNGQDFELGALVVRCARDGQRSRDVGVVVERQGDMVAGERGFQVLFPVQTKPWGAKIFFYGNELAPA